MPDTVDFNFIARQLERVLTEQREMRSEITDMRHDMGGVSGEMGSVRGELTNLRGEVAGIHGDLLSMRGDLAEVRNDLADMRRAILQLIEKAQRHERRFDELEHRIVEIKDDMELMIRSEVMGRLAYFETRMETRFREGFAEGEQPLLTP